MREEGGLIVMENRLTVTMFTSVNSFLVLSPRTLLDVCWNACCNSTTPLSGCFSLDSLRLFFLIRRRIGIDSAFGKSRASIVQSYSAFATDVSSMTSTSLSSSGEPSATY